MGTSELQDLIDRIHSKAESDGYRGFDPYDIKSLPFFRKWSNIRYLGFAQDRLLSVAPNLVRTLFRVTPGLNAKALALFGNGYITLHEVSGNKVWVERARSVLSRLKEMQTQWGEGIGWGYPFDWQSKVFFPAGTPSGVVTSFCLKALTRYKNLTRSHEFDDQIRLAAHFLATGLQKYVPAHDKVCFSYTPLDNMRVHNANVLTAAALMEAFDSLGDRSFLELAVKAFNYTISEQKTDGSWYYFGDTEGVPGYIDNYHTGFVLRALLIYRGHCGGREVESALQKGLHYYKEALFFDRFLPRFSNRVKHPVDVHACGDSLATLSAFSRFDPDCLGVAQNLLEWSVRHLYDGMGGFYYQKYPLFTSRISYMRWNNAWMFYGLTEYLRAFSK